MVEAKPSEVRDAGKFCQNLNFLITGLPILAQPIAPHPVTGNAQPLAEARVASESCGSRLPASQQCRNQSPPKQKTDESWLVRLLSLRKCLVREPALAGILNLAAIPFSLLASLLYRRGGFLFSLDLFSTALGLLFFLFFLLDVFLLPPRLLLLV